MKKNQFNNKEKNKYLCDTAALLSMLLIAANTYSLIMFHYYFTYEENLLFDQTPKSSYLTIQGYCRRKCIRNFGKIRSPVRTQAFKTSGRVK